MSMAEFYTALVSICQLRYLKWNCPWSSNQSLILTTVIYLFIYLFWAFWNLPRKRRGYEGISLLHQLLSFTRKRNIGTKFKYRDTVRVVSFALAFVSYTVKIEFKQLIILPCLLIVHLVQNCAFSPHLMPVKKNNFNSVTLLIYRTFSADWLKNVQCSKIEHFNDLKIRRVKNE